MPAVVPAIDPSKIAALIEENTNQYCLSFARLPGATIHQDRELVWIDSGICDATFNAVVYANIDAGLIETRVMDVLEYFRSRARPFTWHIGPSTRPVGLDRFLERNGMTHSEDEPGMALEIDRLSDNPTAVEGLTIETVSDLGGLKTWVDVWLFGAPAGIRQVCFDALCGRGLGDRLPWRYFLGRLRGKPVATSQLFLAAGVAGVQYVVTVPEARRRGIGAAMTHRVLKVGRAIGYRVGVLTSSSQGHGLYQRLGFRDYCWFRRYVWD